MLSFADLIDPSFQAWGQNVLNQGALNVRDWACLAFVSQDMRWCVNHIFSLLTRTHLEILLAVFPNLPLRLRKSQEPTRIPPNSLVWARDNENKKITNVRLVRQGVYTTGASLINCYTLSTLDHKAQSYPVCQYHNLAYWPILNTGLEITVARLALQEGQERMPKRRKVE